MGLGFPEEHYRIGLTNTIMPKSCKTFRFLKTTGNWILRQNQNGIGKVGRAFIIHHLLVDIREGSSFNQEELSYAEIIK